MPVLVLLATLAVYLSGLAASVYWLDSSELAAAAWGLGIAHPPGHPLAALLGKACTLLPFGPIAFKVGLASSLCGALAAMQCARLGRLVSRRARGAAQASTIDSLLGATAGLLFGLSYAHAFQAVRPEVYALSSLLVLTAVHELALYDETRAPWRLYTAALFAGLALGNHHLLALATLAPAGLIAVLRHGRVRIGRVLVAGTLALAVWGYLPMRAAAHPLVNWGVPSTPSRFWWTITAQAFQKAVARGTTADVPGVVLALTAELYLIGALLALAGVYVLLRRAPTRRLALLLLTAALGGAAAPALVGFDPQNPDAYGYLATSVALLAVLAMVLPAVLLARAPAWTAGPLVLASALTLLVSWPRITLAQRHEAAETFSRFVDAAQPRSRVVTSYYQTIFGLWYLQSAEGARPDIDLIHRHFLAYPGYRDQLVDARPELAKVLGPKDVDLAALGDARLEYDLDLPPSARALTVEVRGIPDEPQARRFAAWQRYLEARRVCELPDPAARQRAIDDARALIGADPELNALAARCLPGKN